MFILTRKRKARLLDKLTDMALFAAYMSYVVRGDDDVELQYNQMRQHLEATLDSYKPRWWQVRRKQKPCIPVPCPPFTETTLEVRHEP